MPVTPEDCFHSTDELYQEMRGSEAERRCVASRSYYSFYHFANRHADSHAELPPSALSGPTHSKLAFYFSNSQDHPHARRMKVRRVGILLRQCHKIRCEADYDIEAEFAEQMLDVHYSKCTQGIDAVKQL